MERSAYRTEEAIDSSLCAVCGDLARVMCPCLQRHFCTLDCQNADWSKGGHHLVCKFDKEPHMWKAATQPEVQLSPNVKISNEAPQASNWRVLGICELLNISAGAAFLTDESKRRDFEGEVRYSPVSGASRSSSNRVINAHYQDPAYIAQEDTHMSVSPSRSIVERKRSHPDELQIYRRSTHPFADTQRSIRQETSLPNYRTTVRNEHEHDHSRYNGYLQPTPDFIKPNHAPTRRTEIEAKYVDEANNHHEVDSHLEQRPEPKRQYASARIGPQMPIFVSQNKPGLVRMNLASNNFGFRGQNHYKHARHLSSDVASNHKPVTEPTSKVRACTWEGCNRTFTRSDHFTRHLNTHTGHRPFTCAWDGCGKSFGQANNLTRHLKTHKKEKLYSCSWEGCAKTFSEANNLANHFRQHSDAGPHMCSWDDCTKTFADPGYMAAHERKHSRTEVFRCTDESCERSFSTRNYLKSHLRTHTIEKPFACTRCFKRFNQSSILSRHVRTHELEQATHSS
ncbi:hypothetical protein SARC_09895 [Sphaeroforma arctica JP610]|uniref:Zinc finger protein n=1 Tax=Sphaeroforma arctica JP610 TaxID=667725 RepID=A0A0L0FLJ5_9EUKA|nr:hypothetical protein SARC_09895 [Sphaeroforma arctica JP610]KNC77649.1 hypothetical protein SARC_09895 [Sphaeroforma arctica JP610]|eukprot:XP_014151551.1 hypothetical protein SARC_09895 [Sphaeroforma arctica JP610]